MSMKRVTLATLAATLVLSGASSASRQGQPRGQDTDRLDVLEKAARSGTVAHKLTDPNELKAWAGEPRTQVRWNSGGMVILDVNYPDGVEARFGKFREYGDDPFTLRALWIKGREVDIGDARRLTLRNAADLRKMNSFEGLQNVSLRNLDLTNQRAYLERMTFDTLTQWPAPEGLPSGFDPLKLIEMGKDPGLGIRALHREGVNGQGVGVAIIDGPLLLGHSEYTSRLVRYDATGMAGKRAEMHGPSVASILVGESRGVAPQAELSYYAAWDQRIPRYIHVLNEVIALNAELLPEQRIRVVSISDGGFDDDPLRDNWRAALGKAREAGILVVTCDERFLKYGTLTWIEGTDPDKPESYKRGRYAGPEDVLLIPAGNKTIASHRGIEVYTYDREGGMSWGAPYIAGLAALAFQVDSHLPPESIVDHLVKTAAHTQAGPVVDPRGFIESIRRSK